MKHGVPKVIYLQICDDPDCDVPYDDHDGITWCSHRLDKTDVKYVLAKDKPQRKPLTDALFHLFQEWKEDHLSQHNYIEAVERLKAAHDIKE